jgi:SAM-dependent methyltransferase
MALYDRIGRSYAARRRPDPRIAAALAQALGAAQSVVNVGAGTGNYEPTDRRVVAVEPSAVMIAQRGKSAAPVVRAVAEALPFAAGAFDAAQALLTVHHWADLGRGLAELRRVARRVVVFTHDAAALGDFWLIRDYLPEIMPDVARSMPPVSAIARALDTADVRIVPVPFDCHDGFLCAYWHRPEAYLDPVVRAGISCFPALPPTVVDAALRRLADDLATGAWQARNQGLSAATAMDFGYRLVVAA